MRQTPPARRFRKDFRNSKSGTVESHLTFPGQPRKAAAKQFAKPIWRCPAFSWVLCRWVCVLRRRPFPMRPRPGQNSCRVRALVTVKLARRLRRRNTPEHTSPPRTFKTTPQQTLPKGPSNEFRLVPRRHLAGLACQGAFSLGGAGFFLLQRSPGDALFKNPIIHPTRTQ